MRRPKRLQAIRRGLDSELRQRGLKWRKSATDEIVSCCHDCYQTGDTTAMLGAKLKERLSPEFWALVNKIWDALGPVLIKILESLFK